MTSGDSPADPQTEDPLRIPEFLRRRPEDREAALRKEWESPSPRPTPIFSATVPEPKRPEPEPDPVLDAARAQKKLIETNRFKRRIAVASQRKERVPGSIWCTRTSRWIHPATELLRKEEDIMAQLKGEKTVAQMTAEYNELATARGLKPVKKFRDLATAKERLAKISKSAAPAPQDGGSSTDDDVVKQFKFKPGSPRHELLKKLLTNLGQPLKAKELGNLVSVIPGILWRIDVSKLPYALVIAKTTEGKTYGLHKREVQSKRD